MCYTKSMLKNIDIDIQSANLIKLKIDYNDKLLSLILTQEELEHLLRTIDVTLMDKYITDEENKNEY